MINDTSHMLNAPGRNLPIRPALLQISRTPKLPLQTPLFYARMDFLRIKLYLHEFMKKNHHADQIKTHRNSMLLEIAGYRRFGEKYPKMSTKSKQT